MNARAPFLTITPEQLKKFESDKDSLTSSAERTMWRIGQLGTLFKTISDTALTDENEEPFKDFAVGDLAKLGSFICNHLFEDAQNLKERLQNLSPLESTKA